MAIRIIVKRTDTSNMTPHGGTHITSYATFDVDVPALERLLRECNDQYMQHQIVGAELLSDPGAKESP